MKEGDRYYFITSYGAIDSSTLDHVLTDYDRKDFMGIYRTRGQAEAVRDKIREFVKTL